MIKLYIIGIFILIIAIIANGIIVNLGLKSWYDLIELLNSDGSKAFSKLKILDCIWLFLGYPLVLGSGYFIGLKCYNWLFS